MAATRTRKTAAAEAPATPAGLMLVESTGIKRATAPGSSVPEEVTEGLRRTLDEGRALAFQTAGTEHAKQVQNWLKTAARTANGGEGVGLSMSTTDNPDGTVTVDFQGKLTKIARKYTNDEIRAWAREQGVENEHLVPRIHKDVREAFKRAHGYTKQTD
jgi:hypothetical protein